MEMQELLQFVKKEHKRLLQAYSIEDKKQSTYPMMLKLVEEVGELSQAILHTDSLQRKEKLEKNTVNIGEEIVDVLLTTLILAENLDINVKKELELKIEKINKRKY